MNDRPLLRYLPVLLAAFLGLGVLTACGADDGADQGGGGRHVVASFYPLAFLATEVGGDHVEVTSLTKPGGEPHDLELSPADVGEVADAELVVYLHGFQPAVDDAVDQADEERVLDVSETARLTKTFTPIEEGEEHADEAGAVDPHFWLDPSRYADVATALADRLAADDPDNAADYRANAEDLIERLNELDADYRAGLASCERTDLVTSHNAFGYLAERYGLEQVGITGLTPEAEPSPDQLAAVTAYVRDHHVETIYFETLVSPAVAETVASETGAATAVLDPVEGLTDDSAGDDYLAVMRSNLETLRQGQGCA